MSNLQPGLVFSINTFFLHTGNTQDICWDELGSEGSEYALIWHIYNDDATKLDAASIEGLNRGIDVLLVFVSPCSWRASFYCCLPSAKYDRLVYSLPF